MIDREVAGVAVLVPPEVVPWKYIVPLPPFEAMIVVLAAQKLPPPVTFTTVGSGLIVARALVRAVDVQPVVVLRAWA